MIILRNKFPTDIKIVGNNGNEFSLKNSEISKFGKWLAKYFPPLKRAQDNCGQFDIIDSKGNEIGTLLISQNLKKKTLVLDLIEVDEKYQRNGIARKILEIMIDFAKQEGFEKISCEAVGTGYAKNLYESLGFRKIKELEKPGTGIWGGLDLMELEL